MKPFFVCVLLISLSFLHSGLKSPSKLVLTIEPTKKSLEIDPQDFSVTLNLITKDGQSENVEIFICKEKHPWRFNPTDTEILNKKYQKNCEEGFKPHKMELIPARILREKLQLRIPNPKGGVIPFQLGMVHEDEIVWSNSLDFTVAKKKS